jgi:hypothetical protein
MSCPGVGVRAGSPTFLGSGDSACCGGAEAVAQHPLVVSNW